MAKHGLVGRVLAAMLVLTVGQSVQADDSSSTPMGCTITEFGTIEFVTGFYDMRVTADQLATRTQPWEVSSAALFRVVTNCYTRVHLADTVTLTGPDALSFDARAFMLWDPEDGLFPSPQPYPADDEWWVDLDPGDNRYGIVNVSLKRDWWRELVKAGAYTGTVNIWITHTH